MRRREFIAGLAGATAWSVKPRQWSARGELGCSEDYPKVTPKGRSGFKLYFVGCHNLDGSGERTFKLISPMGSQ